MASNVEEIKKEALAIDSERKKWISTFKEIADWLMPRQVTWLNTPGKRDRAAEVNENILNPVGTQAARRCAAGLTEGVVSRTRKWFALRVPSIDMTVDREAAEWLANAEYVLRYIFSNSNFYQAFGQAALNMVCFGNGAMWVEPDPERVARYHSLPIGEFAFGVDHTGRVRRLLRVFSLKAKDFENRFSKVPEKVKKLVEKGGESALTPVIVYHYVTPERQYYWSEYDKKNELLDELSVDGWPFGILRWDVIGYDAYGTGPGMEAVPLIKELQQCEITKAKLLDAMHQPPMQADAMLASGGIELIPGGITYVPGLSQAGGGGAVRPIIEVNPNSLIAIQQDIDRLVRQINELFYLDLFLMISQLDTVRTATEIVERRGEKVVMLGPVLQRIEDEALSPLITQTFNLALEAGLLPDPPASLRDADVQIQYISMLHQAQEASDTVSIERFLATIGNVGAAIPDVLMRIDTDRLPVVYAEKLGVDPTIIRTDADVEKIKQEQAAQQQLAQAQQLADGAKTLSETDVGGGMNALQLLTGM